MQRTGISPRRLVMLMALTALLAVSGGMAINMGSTENAEAQSEPLTWHVFDLRVWEPGIMMGDPVNPGRFVEQVPAECTLVPSPHQEAMFFYSCPMPWEPKIGG